MSTNINPMTLEGRTILVTGAAQGIEIIAPILLLVLLGVFLARLRFLGNGFLGNLNKLVFWIALPALLFRSVAHAENPGSETWLLLALLIAATFIVAGLGWLGASLMGLPPSSKGAFSQSVFRGNFAFIGLPVLAYALNGMPGSQQAFATAVIVLSFLTTFCNILAVVVLNAGHPTSNSWRLMLRSIFTNPLILSGMAGMPFAFSHTRLPLSIDRTLEALGGAAVPIALICIGGSLAHARLRGKVSTILTAALLKTFLLPALVFFLAPFFGILGVDLRIALVLAACPTATVSFIMAKQMNGDEHIASGVIVLSTILSAASLPWALFLSR